MPRLGRTTVPVAALLLLCCCLAAAGRELQQAPRPKPPPPARRPPPPAKPTPTPTPGSGYAPSLYECVVKAGLTDLQAALDAAGLKELLSNPKTAMTLVAPDAAAFQLMYTDCQKPAKVKPVNQVKWCSLQGLLKDKAGVSELMRYHLLPGVFEAKKGTQHFPASNLFHKQKTYQATIVRMRLWDGGYEIHGTGRDAWIRGSTRAGSPGTGGNHKCGAGLMHIVDNVMTIDKVVNPKDFDPRG